MLLFVFLGVGFFPHFCSHCCHGWCFFGLGLSVFRIWFGDFALMVWWFFGHGALVFVCAYIIRCGVVGVGFGGGALVFVCAYIIRCGVVWVVSVAVRLFSCMHI